MASSASEVGSVVSSNSLPLFEFAKMCNHVAVGLKNDLGKNEPWYCFSGYFIIAGMTLFYINNMKVYPAT